MYERYAVETRETRATRFFRGRRGGAEGGAARRTAIDLMVARLSDDDFHAAAALPLPLAQTWRYLYGELPKPLEQLP